MLRAATAMMLVATLALTISLGGAVAAKEKSSRGKPIPAELTPPASSVLLFELGARGVQIYRCDAKPGEPDSYVWTFKGPAAELLNARDEVVGRHFGGPTWQGHDGSAVVAEFVARADAPSRNAIPWLLLEAKEHSGNGTFATVTHIQRLATMGGVAPREGCDADHDGDMARVPYEATYAFYYPAAPAA